jgi:very-short-patch-repair endonuclease
MKIHNKKILKKTRKNLRNHMTHAEVILWTQLKGKVIEGLKFRRQHSVENYILDFYCPEKKLSIEVDGFTHLTRKAKIHDNKRLEVLKRYEIDEIRITNEEVYDNVTLVMQKIREKIKFNQITTP